jgi:CBS domain-containing protein
MMPDPPLLDESAPIEQAVALMQAHGLDTLPVVGEGRFVGTIRMVDCCQALLEVNP